MIKKDEYLMTIRLTRKEEAIVKRLKQDYSVNISQYLRNKLIELDEKFRKLMGNKLSCYFKIFSWAFKL